VRREGRLLSGKFYIYQCINSTNFLTTTHVFTANETNGNMVTKKKKKIYISS